MAGTCPALAAESEPTPPSLAETDFDISTPEPLELAPHARALAEKYAAAAAIVSSCAPPISASASRGSRAAAESAALVEQLAEAHAHSQRLMDLLTRNGIALPAGALSASPATAAATGDASSSRAALEQTVSAQARTLEAMRAELDVAKRHVVLATAEKDAAWAAMRRASTSALGSELRKEKPSRSLSATSAFGSDSSGSASRTITPCHSCAYLPVQPTEQLPPQPPCAAATSGPRTPARLDATAGAGGGAPFCERPSPARAALAPAQLMGSCSSRAPVAATQSGAASGTRGEAQARAAEAERLARAARAALDDTAAFVVSARGALLRGQGELRSELRAAFNVILAFRSARSTPQHVLEHLMTQLVRAASATDALGPVADGLGRAIARATERIPLVEAYSPGRGGEGAEPSGGARPAAADGDALAPARRAAPAEGGGADGRGSQWCAAWQWMRDTDATGCVRCAQPFTLLRRRHHCRMCGQLFCQQCSTHRVPLCESESRLKIRVCDGCKEQLQCATASHSAPPNAAADDAAALRSACTATSDTGA